MDEKFNITFMCGGEELGKKELYGSFIANKLKRGTIIAFNEMDDLFKVESLAVNSGYPDGGIMLSRFEADTHMSLEVE
jgi:hypothetical protein